MAINKKRDFKKLSVCIQEFLSRLPCDESTGFLRDTLYLSLLELHKHYVKVKDRLNSSLRQLNGTLTAVSNERLALDKYKCRWHGCEEQGSEEIKTEGFLAALQGDIAKLKATVQSDDGDVLGQTYLMYAIQGKSEQLECFNFLLSLKFNINHQANDGRTALHLACQQNKKISITSLLKHKANTTIQDKKGRTALHWAAINPSSEITKLLLQHGADINVKDCDGMTPVMWACHFNNLENMQVLRNALERVDPRREAIFEDRDDNGKTVLHWAVPMRDKGSVECLKDLLVSDVSHIRNNQGRTVLHTAAKEGCVSACKLILSNCGKEILHVRDNQNQTALHLATLCGHGETVDYLLQNGANTSDEDSGGRTALQEAEFGHYHYCLLVFAAFEQMKGVEKNHKNKPFTKTPKEDERNNTETRKFESWVIPTGFLNDSQEFPKTAITLPHDVDPEPQLVDVTEIKGFEVNGDMVSPDSPRKTSEDITNTKTNNIAPLQRRKRTVEKGEQQSIPATNKLNQTEVSSQENVTVCDDNEHFEEEEYSNQYLQQHGNASSLASNNSAEAQEYSISENLEVSSLGNETDEEHSKSEMENDHSEKDGPEENLKSKESEETQEKSDSLIINTKHKEPTFPNPGGHRVNLTALEPLKQHSFNTPTKLDPIPLSFTTPKNLNNLAQDGKPMQPRGIVAPLQPPVPLGVRHKEELRPLSKEKRPQSDTGKTACYGTQGPGHGPLAHTHGKALLNNIFQPDVLKKKADLKMPESQRKAGRFPHPPKY